MARPHHYYHDPQLFISTIFNIILIILWRVGSSLHSTMKMMNVVLWWPLLNIITMVLWPHNIITNGDSPWYCGVSAVISLQLLVQLCFQHPSPQFSCLSKSHTHVIPISLTLSPCNDSISPPSSSEQNASKTERFAAIVTYFVTPSPEIESVVSSDQAWSALDEYNSKARTLEIQNLFGTSNTVKWNFCQPLLPEIQRVSYEK